MIDIKESEINADQGQYDVYEIMKVQATGAAANKEFDMRVQYQADGSSSSWAIDGMLIDEEMLYLEDEEADKVYQELKARSLRRQNMELQEHRLSISMNREED